MAPVFGKVVGINAQGNPGALQSDAHTAQQVTAQWAASNASADKANELRVLFPAVSYTHLTLPTNREV